jgi:hypothetical protein
MPFRLHCMHNENRIKIVLTKNLLITLITLNNYFLKLWSVSRTPSAFATFSYRKLRSTKYRSFHVKRAATALTALHLAIDWCVSVTIRVCSRLWCKINELREALEYLIKFIIKSHIEKYSIHLFEKVHESRKRLTKCLKNRLIRGKQRRLHDWSLVKSMKFFWSLMKSHVVLKSVIPPLSFDCNHCYSFTYHILTSSSLSFHLK